MCRQRRFRADHHEIDLLTHGKAAKLRHVIGLDVAEERHQGRQTDASAHHLSCICVSKLMRNDTRGNADRGCDIVQIWAQLFDQRRLAFMACQ